MDFQQLIRKLKKEAECPLCLDTVNDPKTLPCLHSFCLLCLNNLASVERRKLKTTVDCPVCRTSFQIPERDTFFKLPTSFYLNQLVDLLTLGDGSAEAQKCSNCEENNRAICYCFVCHHFLCAACFEAHQRMKVNRGHRNVLIENLQTQDVEELIRRPVMCAEKYHRQETLEFFCQDCEVCLCNKCSVVSHNRHKMVDIEKAAEKRKLLIMEDAEKIKAQAAVLETKTKKEAESLAERREEVAVARKKVKETMGRLRAILDEHEAAILTELEHIDETLQRDQATRTESSELLTAQLQSSGEYGEGIIQRNISAEIVQTQSDYRKRCDELKTANTEMEDYELPHVDFVTNEEEKTIEKMRRLLPGRVVVSHTDPLQCLAKGKGLREAEVGRESHFTVATRDSDGKQFYCYGDVMTLEIRTNKDDEIEKKIENHKDGNYTVSYKPITVGQHEVIIKVNGVPLFDSPWRPQVSPHQYKTVFTFGSPGSGQGHFDGPYDIAVSKRTGNIAVADFSNGRIEIFSSDGRFLREFGQKGPCAERIGEPTSVAFSRSGEILVVHSKMISVFSESGQFVKHIKNRRVHTPGKVSVGSDGRLCVSDCGDQTIKILTPDGTELLYSFSPADCAWSPYSAVYHQNKFFVSYPFAHCVKVFTKEGAYLYDIGTRGTGDGQLNYPDGVAIDTFSNLIVADKTRLQVFTLDGKFLNKIAAERNPEFGRPEALAICNLGQVFVTDLSMNCVHVFK